MREHLPDRVTAGTTIAYNHLNPDEASGLRKGTYRSLRRAKAAVSLVSIVLISSGVFPSLATASSFSDMLSHSSTSVLGQLLSSMKPAPKVHAAEQSSNNLQKLALPKAAMNIDPTASKGGGDVVIADDSALVADEGPSGAGADIVKPKNSTISIYVVRSGDTLSGIADMFDVSVNTILWANDMKRGAALKVGQTLTILPVTGVRYTVKKGDTLASIAKAHHGDAEEIASFNGIDSSSLVVGEQIIIPDGEVTVSVGVAKTPKAGTSSSGAVSAGYYLRPIVGGTRTQGIHGYNGVDIAAARGTAILAAAAGEVIISREGGWNGGYGNYIVIRHANGTQTLYAHNSDNIVGVGQQVQKGQVIGHVGSTGRSTGSHLHFEIRGGPRNPF